MLNINTSAIDAGKLESLLPAALSASETLKAKSGAGSEYTDWVDLPRDYDKAEFARIKPAAERLSGLGEVLVVVGIGGSYLGARAALDYLNSSFYNGAKGKKTPDIYFAGCNLSEDYLKNLTARIGERDFTVNVISKSGSTIEPAVAFRYFRNLLEKKYGKSGARERIIATTDKSKGILKALSDEEGYETFVIPDGVGGRYSVFTPVGLLPIAASGVDIERLMQGAFDMAEICKTDRTLDNPALSYAASRNYLYNTGKKIEVLAGFDPDFMYIAEWWKQLYGESEGKGGRGIFPASVNYTADLHSMGQYLQDGERTLFETFIVEKPTTDGIMVSRETQDIDKLNYLAGKAINEINNAAYEGTKKAHMDGGVPCLTINTGGKDAYSLGELLYFFMYACGVSGYMLGVNPFNQPGVEAYKSNMLKILGKS